MNPCADEVEVTDTWFVPHFPARETDPLEVEMLRAWKEYMSWEEESSGGWSTRIAGMLSLIPRGLNERGGRVATTFAVYLMTNLGRSFLCDLFKEVHSSQVSSREIKDIVVSVWASANKLNSYVRNTLEMLLRNEKREPVYAENPHPTLEDNRVVEMVTCFFVTDEGKNLLREVYSAAGRQDLPF